MPGDTPEAAGLGARRHLLLSSFWFALSFQGSALIGIAVPAQVLHMVNNAQKAFVLGVLGSIAALAGTAAQPIAGVMSDLSRSRWGRRRPFIVGGLTIDVIGLLLMASAWNLPVLAVGFLLATVGSSVSGAAYQAYVPDMVPATQYGEQSGYIGALTMLGTVVSFGLAAVLVTPGNAVPFYGATIVAMTAGAALILTTVREPAIALVDRPTVDSWRSLWLEPWHHPDFVLVCATRALMMLALYALFSFVEFYVRDVLRVTEFVRGVAVVGGLATLAAAGGGVLTGILSDRVGRKPIVGVAGIVMTIAFVVLAFSHNLIAVLVVGVVFGLALGAFSAVDWALAIDVLPSRGFAAKDLGIWGISTNLPQAIAPFAGGALLTLLAPFGESTGYEVLFLVAATCSLASATLVWRLRTVR